MLDIFNGLIKIPIIPPYIPNYKYYNVGDSSVG